LTLEESSPKTGAFAFWQKKASPMKEADLRDTFKKSLQEYLKINCCSIS